MRLIACMLSLGLFSAGCALQAGDPSAQETATEHPSEAVAAPGADTGGRVVLPTAVTPDQAGGVLGQTQRTGASHGPAAPTAAGVSSPAPTGGPPAGDNPNPQPWGSGTPGLPYQGPTPGTGN